MLTFPVGLDVMGWPSPGALIASARLGALASPGGGTSFGVSTGASLGFLPDLRGSTDDKNRTLAVRGIDILAAVSQVLGPVRLDLLAGYTGGLGDSANLITMFLRAGGRFK